MLVDDQQGFLDLARMLLQAQPGIRVIGEATSGEEAIVLLHRLKPKAVVIDVQMPGMTGFEAARKLLEISPDLRIVIVSNFDDPEYTILTQSIGAQGFFSKKAFPVETIARLLRGP